MAENNARLLPEYLKDLSVIDESLKNKFIKYILISIFPEDKKSLSLYVYIYNFVGQYENKDEEAENLYNYYRMTIEYTSNELAKELKLIPSNKMFDLFIDICNRMDTLISWMSRSFAYIDCYFVKSRSHIKKLEHLAFDIYRNNIFLPFQKQLSDELNKLLEEDRNGNKAYRKKIQNILNRIKSMDLALPKIIMKKNVVVWTNEYNEYFEKPSTNYWFKLFLDEIEKFFSSKAIKDLQKLSTPEYVSMQLNFLEEEKERQNALFKGLNLERLNEIIYKELIGKNMIKLLEMDSGLKYMLENNKNEELSNLFDLFKLYEPSLHEIAKIFKDYIHNRLNALYKNEEINKVSEKIVPKLIELKKEINTLVEKFFKNNDILKSTEENEFYEYMSPNYFPKQIAEYLDYCMRKGFKGKNQATIDSSLDGIIELLKNLQSKDFFLAWNELYTQLRLNKYFTLSIKHEKNFANRLKNDLNIFLDAEIVNLISFWEEKEIYMEEYSKTPSKGKPNEIKFNIEVLPSWSGKLRDKNLIAFNLPKLFSSCIEDFEKYYLGKYTNHNLKWFLNN